jgi:hypothetical protein
MSVEFDLQLLLERGRKRGDGLLLRILAYSAASVARMSSRDIRGPFFAASPTRIALRSMRATKLACGMRTAGALSNGSLGVSVNLGFHILPSDHMLILR